jgi:hypothetical protein
VRPPYRLGVVAAAGVAGLAAASLDPEYHGMKATARTSTRPARATTRTKPNSRLPVVLRMRGCLPWRREASDGVAEE